ncbi:MAG: hypothetical protein ABH804_02355 [archaeon]
MIDDFLYRRVSEEEKEEIKKQARKIMGSFSKKLSKIDKKISEPVVERGTGEREESTESRFIVVHRDDVEQRKEDSGKCDSNFSKEIMFENAPKKNKDFIISEKGGWN